jgi:hypothetical protein
MDLQASDSPAAAAVPELPVEALEAVVNRCYHVFDGRPIRDFIPSWSNTRHAKISMAVILRQHDRRCASEKVISRYRPGTGNRGGVHSTALEVVGSQPYGEIVA